ncbi:hypothetical protein GIB67_019104 [Kingdonia uniflora]|uniref:Guanylate-binding protein N-terminal domain-containing protein n=1 Tax=Kingdonia uniflora TaxID=39325 RepID=A0A7J7MZH7_9MAGN|nr:hypothetical protein GIB67_019104 [Kingdonia uniflora]
MEEVRGLRLKRYIKSAKVMDENSDEASKMLEITSSIPFLPRIVIVRNNCENSRYGFILEKFQKRDKSLVGRIKGSVVDSTHVAAPDHGNIILIFYVTRVWVWGTPLEIMVDGVKTSVLYLDTEGFECIGKSNVYDERIFALAAVMSSVLVYNLPETGQDVAFEPAKLLWLIQRDFLQGKTVQEMVNEALQRVLIVMGTKILIRSIKFENPSRLWVTTVQLLVYHRIKTNDIFTHESRDAHIFGVELRNLVKYDCSDKEIL